MNQEEKTVIQEVTEEVWERPLGIIPGKENKCICTNPDPSYSISQVIL